MERRRWERGECDGNSVAAQTAAAWCAATAHEARRRLRAQRLRARHAILIRHCQHATLHAYIIVSMHCCMHKTSQACIGAPGAGRALEK
eukprot:233870-Chlamydomonas_euryale.AAC.3